MNTIIKALRWRYATKKFDAQKKLSEGQIDVMLEALRLAPSSFGIQPWKFVVVNNPATREQLKAAAWNQTQVTDASHFIVISVPSVPDESLVDAYLASMKKDNPSLDDAKLGTYEKTMKGFMKMKTPEALKAWVRNQAYIALGVVLTAAAAEKIDACPMEGFDSVKFNEILDFKTRGLESVACVALGFRSAEDKHANEPKSRFAKEDVIVEIN